MGQKVNPINFRLGYIRKSNARWFPPKGVSIKTLLNKDLKALAIIEAHIPEAAGVNLERIIFERTGTNLRLILPTAKPGIALGKKGEDIEELRRKLTKEMGAPVHITIEEIRKPELEAPLVARSIAQQLERRVMFRRAMKRAVSTAMRLGAKGIKVVVSGRLGGAEIARTEAYREGRIPLHTLRADIDYGTAIAKTTYGVIGVKIWIFKGEVLGKQEQGLSEAASN
jgi:small subunit ribosomal protein S3